MATVSSPSGIADSFPFSLPRWWTLGDLQRHLGDISADRVRLFPLPGTGTADDAELIQREGDRLCELVDGVLVEKPIESLKSLVAIEVAFALRRYLEDHPLGVVLGADGLLQIGPKLVRGPDVSFISWERFPGRTLPVDRIWGVVPDLAVEVLAPGNTQGEMQRKVADYFGAGVGLVWIVDPAKRTAVVHSAGGSGNASSAVIAATGELPGEEALPGFKLELATIFLGQGS